MTISASDSIWIQNYNIWLSEENNSYYKTESPCEKLHINESRKILCHFNYDNRTKVIAEITEIHISGKGYYLGRDKKWYNFKPTPVSLGPWGFRWFVICKDDNSYFSCLNTNQLDVLEYFTQGDVCIIRAYWLDAKSHPLIYFETGVGESQRAWEYREGNSMYELEWYDCNLREIKVPSFLPESYQAVFVLTDHADFVSPDVYLPIFYGNDNSPGILSLGLTATVSLFCVSNKENRTEGLDQKAYKEMADIFYDNGIEIASHSIGAATGTARTVEWFDANIQELQRYQPVTWIDHGSDICRPDNLIAMGWDNTSLYYRFNRVYGLGYRNLWSGIDIAVDPVGNFGILSQEPIPIKRVYQKIWYALKSGQILYFIRETFRILYQSTSPKSRNYLIMAASKFTHIFRQISPVTSFLQMIGYMLKGLCLLCSPINLYVMINNLTKSYRPVECGVIFYESMWYHDMVCFNTIRVNDLHNMLSTEALECLYTKHDVFIGHVYLGDRLPQHPQKAFDVTDSGICINSEFSDGLIRLARYHKEGKIWVTTLDQLANFWRKWRKSQLALDSTGKVVVLQKKR